MGDRETAKEFAARFGLTFPKKGDATWRGQEERSRHMVQGPMVEVVPSSNEELEAALYPVTKLKPVIPTYSKLKELRLQGADLHRFNILLHTPTCHPVSLPAHKAIKWINPSKGFHFADGPPHVEPPAAIAAPAPGVPPSQIVPQNLFRCRAQDCPRFFDSENGRKLHERSHK